MKIDGKKMAAITAAVFACIKQEEEALAGTLAQPDEACITGIVPFSQPHSGVWSSSGRNAQMQMRAMMQMRVFR